MKIFKIKHWNALIAEGKENLEQRLAEALNEYTEIDFSFEYLDPVSHELLFNVLKQNTTITKIILLEIYTLYNNEIILLADAIRRNTTLELLTLSAINMDNEGAKALAEALRDNKNLKIIDLSINKITDEGVKALAKALEYSSINILDLTFNSNIQAEGKKALAAALQKNTSLIFIEGLANNNLLGEENSSLIRRNRQIFIDKCQALLDKNDTELRVELKVILPIIKYVIEKKDYIGDENLVNACIAINNKIPNIQEEALSRILQITLGKPQILPKELLKYISSFIYPIGSNNLPEFKIHTDSNDKPQGIINPNYKWFTWTERIEKDDILHKIERY